MGARKATAATEMRCSAEPDPAQNLVIAHDLLHGRGDRRELLHSFRGCTASPSATTRCSCCCPAFVVYAGVVYFLFDLYDSKWRFASLPDLMNIVRAATVLAVSLLVLDYILVAPQCARHFFFGKITIALYWVLQMAFLGGPRIAYRYFRYTRTRHHARAAQANPTLVLGRAADAEVLLRAIESGAVTKIWPVGILSPSLADRGQSMRGIPVVGGFGELERVVAKLARGNAIMRLIFTPSAFEPDAKPEATLMHARRLGLQTSRLPSLTRAASAAACAGRTVEDLLLRPSVTIDYHRLESFVRAASRSSSPAAAARSARKSATGSSRSAPRGCS